MSYSTELLISITIILAVMVYGAMRIVMAIHTYRKKHAKLTGWQQFLMHEAEIKCKTRHAL